MPVVGFLDAGSAAERVQQVAAVRKGLAEGGYQEGQNVALEFRHEPNWSTDPQDWGITGSAEAAEAANFYGPGQNHMRTEEEIARFCAEHGVTDSDLLIAQVLVPFETRPGETAKDAYERELRAMVRNDDHGRKSQEALADTA